MFTLLAAGTSAFWLTMPISVAIVVVLGIIVVSYRQTIRAYPNGGGSYIVAKDNLGPMAGLIAAAALLVDYVLTVSVSVAAGIAAITSAFPGALGDMPRLARCASCIAVVMLVNLRGIRESGTVFAIPTYVFLVSMLALLAIGIGADAARRRAAGDRRHAGRRADRDARPAPADARVRRRLQRDHRASRRSPTACPRSSDRRRHTPGRRSRSWACSSASCSSASRTWPA